MTTEPTIPPHHRAPPDDPAATTPDPYLWDRTGTADPAVKDLEDKLASLRLRPRNPFSSHAAHRSPWTFRALAAAAVVVLAATAVVFMRRPGPSWEVVALTGSPLVDSSVVKETARLTRNDWLETDARSRASLTVANIGSVTVEPGSRLRLVETNDKHHRIQLAKGTIGAFINAPPRLFFVDTPSAEAIDMGCIYTLTVADDGSAQLKTTFGLVELARSMNGREVVSKVPSGAVCRTDLSRGPGTPRFEDAPEPLVSALDAFDAGALSALSSVTQHARVQDTLTLWHLLARTEGTTRQSVLDTIVALAGRPTDATDQATLAINPAAMEKWWLYLRDKW